MKVRMCHSTPAPPRLWLRTGRLDIYAGEPRIGRSDVWLSTNIIASTECTHRDDHNEISIVALE